MNHSEQSDVILLCDGKQAFPRILNEIESAQHNIYINMFVWRNDAIGQKIARGLLHAADRGVHVEITKDRYGIACEYSEEDQTSFFHEHPSTDELLSIRTLEHMYNRDLSGKEHIDQKNELRDALMHHPNCTVHCEDRRYDHSKFYVFDQRTMIFGGINIEDKENGADRAGRTYRDYMVCLRDTALVAAFWERRSGIRKPAGARFVMNLKKPVRLFETENRYLDLIRNAQRELTILMAYFAPIPAFIEVIEQAAARGVHVRILIPKNANFINDLNRKTMQILFDAAQQKNLDLRIYLSNDMTHTKLLMSESTILVGSCNITKNAFAKLDELNYAAPNDDSRFAETARESVQHIIEAAEQASSREALRYNKFQALLEGILM